MGRLMEVTKLAAVLVVGTAIFLLAWNALTVDD
jgi:hypothetical protein